MSKEKRHGDNGPAPKHRPTPPPNPLTIEHTQKQVIENKLLAALDNEGKVAILASEQDLKDFMFAFDFTAGNACYSSPEMVERLKRVRRFSADMTQLYNAAFKGK
jgi:hypothetical protein